jgi:hypothetical protein
MGTDCFASDDIEATARRTGFVNRAAKITGQIFLALVTFGVWDDADPTLAPLAAQVTPLDEQRAVSPEAIDQRMHKRALAFLQALLCQALAQGQTLEKVGDAGLLPAFAKVYLAASTGLELPHSVHALLPGSGGRATQAGANIQAGWAYKRSGFDHFALTPWPLPDPQYVDIVVALAPHGVLLLFDLGYVKIKAFARIADAGAYFVSRLNHPTTILHAKAEGLPPLALAAWLPTVASPCIETPIFLGAQERVACRLVASRVPEPIVKARSRRANKKAKKKGYTPSKAHLTWLAWHLFITNVPQTIGQIPAGLKAYPLRWPIELILKSWKSDLHVTSIKSKKEASTVCHLYGRMLLILLTYALSPADACDRVAEEKAGTECAQTRPAFPGRG